MTTLETDRPKNNHGGRRPGAGAPRHNINALKLVKFSDRYKDAAALIGLIPQLRERWLDLREVADAPLKDGESPWKRRRARYRMKVMLDATAEVISPSNYILGYVAEVARERLEPPTPWRVNKYALMGLNERAAPERRIMYILSPLRMIRDDAPDLATLLFQPLLEDFEAREAAFLGVNEDPPDLPLSSQACPEPGRKGERVRG
jgi:hypothetical protein